MSQQKASRIRRGVWTGLVLVVGGCGKSDYLPPPRVSLDDEEAAAVDVAAEIPVPAVTPTTPAVPVATHAVTPPAAPQIAGSVDTPSATPTENSAPVSDATPQEAAPSQAPLSAAEQLARQPIADKPAEPLSPEARLQWTIGNLEHLGGALERFFEEWEFYPSAYYSPEGKPLLSWRVRLLPTLGMNDLYRQFKLSEPWDSPHNLQLLGKIPLIYQSPERFDGRTNLLAPDGPGAVYQQFQGQAVGKMTDGVTETILAVEVDEERAVPWTKPEEWTFKPFTPRAGLGALREGGFLAVLGNRQVRWVPKDAGDAAIKALFTIQGGERISAAQITQEAAARAVALTTPAATNDVGSAPSAPLAPLAPAVTPGPSSSASSNLPSAEGTNTTVGLTAKLPVPTQVEQDAAQAVVKELFVAKYEAAKKPEEKKAVATEMMAHVARLREDPAARYVVLRVARDIAADHGAVELARRICEQMSEEYAFDSVSSDATTIRKLAASLKEHEKKLRADLAKWAGDTLDRAYQEDNFTSARELYQMAVSLARSAEDREVLRDVMKRHGEVDAARKEFAQVAAVMENLSHDPDDPHANQVVGQYFCFVKQQWERGLPLLSKAGDRPLADLATEDLLRPTTPEAQVLLADGWWSLADKYSDPQKRVLKTRAQYWYREALAHLPEGLLKIKAEMRLKDEKKTDE